MADTFALSVHACWRCRHSGACCSSGWPIPIDAIRLARIEAAGLSHGATRMVPPSRTHAEEAHADTPVALLGVTRDQHCVLHDVEKRACAVHRALGHDALPLSCRMFPRVCLTDARGTRISLSHYCPSAAARLFDADAPPLRIVRSPEAFPAGGEYDGLDARDAFPPLLRPGVLLDLETADALERFGVACFAEETTSPDAALDRFAALCEALRAWRVEDGALLTHFHRVREQLDNRADPHDARSSADDRRGHDDTRRHGDTCSHARARHDIVCDDDDMCRHDDRCRHDDDGSHGDRCSHDARGAWRRTWALDAEVRGCVPHGISSPAGAAPRDPAACGEAYREFVAPVWSAMTQPICRYLAARLFGGWTWYQGQGVRSLVRSLDAALAVVRVEAARQALDSGRMLDRTDMRDAIRQADLLGLHLASRNALAARWGAAERGGLRS